MAIYYGDKLTSRYVPITGVQAQTTICIDSTANLDTDLGADDLILFATIPELHRVVDAVLISDDLDTDGTPAISLDLGILNAAGDELETDLLIDNTTIAQAGGVVRADEQGGMLFAVDRDGKRTVAAQVVAAAATPAAGNLTLRLTYAPV